MNPTKFLFLLLFSLVMTSAYAQIKPPIKPGPIKPGPSLPSQPINECALLSTALKKQSKGEGPCCYQVVLNNRLAPNTKIFPASFQVSIKNGNITNVYGTASTWQQMPSTVPAKTKKVIWKQGVKIPSGLSNLATICLEGKNPIWVYQTWFDRTGKVLCQDSLKVEGCINEPTDLCDNPLIRNSGFSLGNTRPPTASPWAVGYGNPQFLNTPNEGCFDPGYVQASGNQSSGDAIAQALLPLNSIRRGRKYVLNVGVRFFAKPNALDYARISAIAFNGVLPKTGSHPALGPNLALIGRSGKIRDCGDWSVIEFPVWIANKDFQNFAIQVFTNDGNTSQLWIDNVYLCETTEGSDCDEVALDASGKPIMPAGYGTVPAGFTCVAEEEEDTYNNGSLQDLYGQLYGYNGTTNWYAKATDKCFSIGGTLPPEVLNYNCDDSLKMLGINLTCEELQKMLGKNETIDLSTLPKLPFLPPLQEMKNTCTLETPAKFRGMAFQGRDIIYIHGLQLSHLCDRADGIKPGAKADWPSNATEFYTGYYKAVADSNWKPHIEYFLRGKGNKNRYLIVTYNCSQPAEVAVHSVLAQIREAMETGKGVVADNLDPRKNECFGRDYVFVSHSTGAIVADVALSIAHFTKIMKNVRGDYGDIGLIADRCKGRVALHGAFTGSSLATLLVGAQQNSLLSGIASAGLTAGLCDLDLSIGVNKQIVLNSILVDLIPPVTRLKWGPLIAAVPVPVLNVSGGHPSANVNVLKYGLHVGFDDGVVSMDCANTLINQPSHFSTATPPRVFDMGIPLIRGIHYYLDQRLLLNKYGSAFTPYLSPTGMVQPVLTASPLIQAPNHYAFVQAASEHMMPKNATYFANCNYEDTAPGKSRNYEEQLVVTNPAVFNLGLVDPAIITEMKEEIRGKYISYPVIRIKMVKGFPKPTIYWKRFYIWKRTYHLLREDCWYDCDYVYRYAYKS